MTNFWRSFTKVSKVFLTLSVTLLISACNTEEFTNSVSDNILNSSASASSTYNDTSTNVTVNNHQANQAAVITGKSDGEVTEDLDGNQDGKIAAPGSLNIVDNDPGESAFVAETINSPYGSLDISANGDWLYILSNNLPAIQSLDDGDFLTDNLIVKSVDGTEHTIVITILGADEVLAGNNPASDPAPEPMMSSDINLSWSAPSLREDDTGISLSEIAGYKIYYGESPGSYPDSISVDGGDTNSYTMSNFSEGTYYFVITTRDTEGRESQYSSVISVTI